MKKWQSFYIGGQKWTAYLVAPTNPDLQPETPGDKPYVGRCLFDKCVIKISRELGDQAREDTLIHEILHVLIRSSGMWDVLEEAVGENVAGRAEETFVSVGTPLLHRLLTDLGFRFPRYL